VHILLTGATGKVGSRAARRLAKRHTVRLLVRDAGQARDLQAEGFAIRTGDLTQPETLGPAVDGVDAIVHLAAFFRGATPEQMDAVNHIGTLELARRGLEAGTTRFVLASTGLVYAAGLHGASSENGPVQPALAYPASKLAAENGLLDCQRSRGLDLRILRLAFVYGDLDPHLLDSLPRLRERPGGTMFQLVHHADVARAIELALGDDAHGIYNVADDQPLRIHDVQRLLGQPVTVDDAPVERSSGRAGVMDGTRIRAELGFSAEFPSLSDAIARDAL
jgi:UDP-glucose 4-epimerase